MLWCEDESESEEDTDSKEGMLWCEDESESEDEDTKEGIF